jgi:hypothetical protein
VFTRSTLPGEGADVMAVAEDDEGSDEAPEPTEEEES